MKSKVALPILAIMMLLSISICTIKYMDKQNLHQLQKDTLLSANIIYNDIVPDITNLALKVAIKNGFPKMEAYRQAGRIAGNEEQLDNSPVVTIYAAHFHARIIRDVTRQMRVRNLKHDSIIRSLIAIDDLNGFVSGLLKTDKFENKEELEAEIRRLMAIQLNLGRVKAELKKELDQKPSPTT